jgi:crooked neck
MMGKMEPVKNKQPAPMQITAEQILREARERQEDDNYTAPAQKVMDPEELAVFRMRERKHFEDRLRMNRNAMGAWIKYAAFEEAQRDFERARSVYERALDVDHRNSSLWLKYAEMEMRNRHVNAARNVWDRAVTMMPRIDAFWFKARTLHAGGGLHPQAHPTDPSPPSILNTTHHLRSTPLALPLRYRKHDSLSLRSTLPILQYIYMEKMLGKTSPPPLPSVSQNTTLHHASPPVSYTLLTTPLPYCSTSTWKKCSATSPPPAPFSTGGRNGSLTTRRGLPT